MTIADQLTLLGNTKAAIKAAIEDKGVTVGLVPFGDYPEKIAEISGGGGGALTPYVRPADWPTMPTVLETDQKFVGIHAVFENDENFCALSAAGDYTVDWGDGTVENFAANVVAYHTYDFADADLPAATERGYKCAVVTITPQAGGNLTVLNLHKKHNRTGLQHYSSGFLDIAIAGQYLTDLRLGVEKPGTTTQSIRLDKLERINVVRSNVKQASHLLYNCRRLEKVEGIATSLDPSRTVNVTFQDTGDTVSAVGHGFADGDAVIFSSIVDTTGITAYTVYFVVNATADTFKVSKTYGGAAMALTTDGSGVALAGTNFSNMFSGCYSLQSVPLLNTAAGTNFSSMFSVCYSLQSVPLLNTAAGTNFSNMFSVCSSLQSVPLLNTAAGTNFFSMFQGCSSLQSVPLLNTAAGTNFNGMFSGCSSLQSVPLLNTAAGTDFSSMFFTCSSLANIDATGFNTTFSVASCKLSAAALNKLYTNLPVVTGQTLTVTGNYGTASDNPTIATAKGWTVVG